THQATTVSRGELDAESWITRIAAKTFYLYGRNAFVKPNGVGGNFVACNGRSIAFQEPVPLDDGCCTVCQCHRVTDTVQTAPGDQWDAGHDDHGKLNDDGDEHGAAFAQGGERRVDRDACNADEHA